MAIPQYVTKSLITASSTTIGTFSSGGTYTAVSSVLDTPRRVLIWGSSALGATSLTIVGFSGTATNLTPISEAVVTSTTVGATFESKQDFLLVTNVILSCGVASTTGYLGTSSHGGTPWQPIDNLGAIGTGFYINPSSSLVSASFEYTMDYPSYNNVTKQWSNTAVPGGPQPTVSSMGSTTNVAAAGYLLFPAAAWRMTLTSSSSTAGSVTMSVVQSAV